MGKKHHQPKHKKGKYGWADVFMPKFIPWCPLCGSTKHVDQDTKEAVIFTCDRCKIDFVCVEGSDEPIPVEDLTDNWPDTPDDKKQVAEKIIVIGSPIYALGSMVEEVGGAGTLQLG